MGFKCGIIGLPNVGKSTLFNALTQTSQAQAENYPFCTIEPNVGSVSVPDQRLNLLGELSKSKQIIPTRMAGNVGMPISTESFPIKTDAKTIIAATLRSIPAVRIISV